MLHFFLIKHKSLVHDVSSICVCVCVCTYSLCARSLYFRLRAIVPSLYVPVPLFFPLRTRRSLAHSLVLDYFARSKRGLFHGEEVIGGSLLKFIVRKDADSVADRNKRG